MTINIKTIILTFQSDRPFKEETHHFRGFFANKFTEFSHLHQHYKEKLVYRYPLVQYKKIKDQLMIIGINHGADLLAMLYDKFDNIKLKNSNYHIYERGIKLREIPYGLIDQQIKYDFLTPWLGLNQKNYFKYYDQNTAEERKSFLERILTGNILSMSKTLDYFVNGKIKCQLNVRTQKERIKDANVIGFIGNFETNFILPDYIGLGKSVSRGFGTIKRNENQR